MTTSTRVSQWILRGSLKVIESCNDFYLCGTDAVQRGLSCLGYLGDGADDLEYLRSIDLDLEEEELSRAYGFELI
jgi:hypothetical protein